MPEPRLRIAVVVDYEGATVTTTGSLVPSDTPPTARLVPGASYDFDLPAEVPDEATAIGERAEVPPDGRMGQDEYDARVNRPDGDPYTLRNGGPGQPWPDEERTTPHTVEHVLVLEVVNLIEAALLCNEPRRGIWSDADYLCAALAMLTGDGDRARAALLARTSSQFDMPELETVEPGVDLLGREKK